MGQGKDRFMIGIKDFERISRDYERCWNLENHDSPLLQIAAPKKGAVRRVREASLEERWTDIGFLIESARERMENTYYGGVSYPSLWPNLGPDIFGAILGGCDLKFGEDTVWAVAEEGRELSDFTFEGLDAENPWLKKLLAMTEAMLDDARGEYLVGMTDLHGGMDAMVSLRGPEQLCLDMVEEPELVKELCLKSFQVYRELYEKLNAMLLSRQKGTTNWMGVYHPDSWYVSSCDLICMISPEMYWEFVEPEVRMEIGLYGNSIFHLDGPGALRHLDSLLALPELRGIQWVYGAGQPSAAHWIPVMQKIQDAGKMVHILAEPSDLPAMKKHLRPEGLILNLSARDEEEAREVEAYVRDWRK